jgi:hypothetical protein
MRCADLLIDRCWLRVGLYRVEDALEYQATWAAFALQSKVLTDHMGSLSLRKPVLIDTRIFLQDLSESAAAVKRKQKVSYDNLGESARNKAKL